MSATGSNGDDQQGGSTMMDWKTGLTALSVVVAAVSAFYAWQIATQSDLHELTRRVDGLENRPVPLSDTQVTALIDEKLSERPSTPLPIPVGAMIAFNTTCPDGWAPFDSGAGKFLLGAGEGVLRLSGPHSPSDQGTEMKLTPVDVGAQGGAERHKLTYEETPSFSRPAKWGTSSDHKEDLDMTPILSYKMQDSTISERDGLLITTTGESGEKSLQVLTKRWMPDIKQDVAHNNMPPYIAVQFCEKVSE